MKLVAFLIPALMMASVSFAQGGAPAGGAATMTKKEAKKACKDEGKKGKEMKACIKEKMGK